MKVPYIKRHHRKANDSFALGIDFNKREWHIFLGWFIFRVVWPAPWQSDQRP